MHILAFSRIAIMMRHYRECSRFDCFTFTTIMIQNFKH